MTKLRACDCGAADSMGMDITEALDPPGWCEATVLCYSCYRQGPMCIAETEETATTSAIAGWNARPAEDRLRARIAMLEAIARKAKEIVWGEPIFAGEWDAEDLLGDIDAALEVTPCPQD